MPPKKTAVAKEKQVSGDQASELILEYLRKQNRPYSTIEIVANLHDAVSKANATKALKDLTEKELIKEKVSGKQAIYHITQDPKDAATPDELKEMSIKTESLKGEITALKSDKRELETELAALRGAPTASSLTQTLHELKTNIAEINARLGPLRAGTIAPVSATEKAAVDNELAKFERILTVRRKMFKELWSMAADIGEQNKKDLWERLGLEDD